MVLDSSLLNSDRLKKKQERYLRVPGSLASAGQKALLLIMLVVNTDYPSHSVFYTRLLSYSLSFRVLHYMCIALSEIFKLKAKHFEFCTSKK